MEQTKHGEKRIDTKVQSSAASDSMEWDNLSAAPGEEADEAWKDQSIASLKQEAQKLDSLVKTLQDQALPAAAATEKLGRLQKYIRSLQPQGQRMDTLTAQIKRGQKSRDNVVSQQEELQRKLREYAEKLEKFTVEEQELQSELDLVRRDVADTMVDGSNLAVEVKEALHAACQELRAAVSVPDNTQGQQMMSKMDAVLGSLARRIAPQHAASLETLQKSASAPAVGIPDAATQRATDAELAAANAPPPGDALADPGYGAAPKQVERKGPYAKDDSSKLAGGSGLSLASTAWTSMRKRDC